MSKVETTEEWENRLLRERAAEAASVFNRAARPIYEMTTPGRNPKIKPAGSCTLLSIDGHRVAISAAHVLDARSREKTLFAGGISRLVPIVNGKVDTTTRRAGSNQGNDRFDCGFWEIPKDEVSQLGDVDFIDSARISANNAPTDRYHKALGYRISRNKDSIDNPTKNITPAQSGYCGSVSDKPELARELGVSGAEHLFMNFDSDNITDEAGNPANIFSPVGFSGGMLMDLGDFSDTTWAPALSGMLIEHRAKHKALVAVRIHWILNYVRSKL